MQKIRRKASSGDKLAQRQCFGLGNACFNLIAYLDILSFIYAYELMLCLNCLVRLSLDDGLPSVLGLTPNLPQKVVGERT